MKIKNLKTLLTGVSLIVGLNSCYNLQHAIKLKKYDPISKEQKDSLFNELNPGLKEYLGEVYIIDKKDLQKNSIAHFHAYAYNFHKGALCLSEDYKNESETRFHEVAHSRYFALKKNKSDFSKRWRKIADFKYGRKNIKDIWTWKDGTDGPKDGMLNPHSVTGLEEDVAHFVESLGYDKNPRDIGKLDSSLIDGLAKKISKERTERDSLILEKNYLLSKPLLNFYDSLSLGLYSSSISIYSLLIELDSLSRIRREEEKPKEECLIFRSYYPLYFADTTDHRYQKKLDLLKEYNFFTEEEHKKLSKDLGSLNYLLKEEK
ncbi:MAG: hypothetical protein Q8O84_01305 [Nanoarchaeota archaeon]|nr:hypothetical protein [Nanoarchaeota archaeon]